MRELVVDSQVESRGVRRTLGGSDILQKCENRLLDIEQNLNSSVCTFEAVRWALSELQRLELYEPNSVLRDPLNEGEEDEPRFLLERRGINAGSEENIQGTQQSKIVDVEMEDLQGDGQSGTLSVQAVSDSVKSGVEQVEGPEKLDAQDEGLCESGSSGKRKPNEDSSTVNETEKRAKVGDASTLKEAVTTADHGEAGKRMAERINTKFAVPERIYLTNLVSHCLLVSLDQIPTKSVEHAIASHRFDNTSLQKFRRGILPIGDSEVSGFYSKAAADDEDAYSTGEGMWLFKWLAGVILSDAGDNEPFASLDWLLAFMTATHQSLVKPILDDLASDLLKQELGGFATISSYMRRIGVLEYAALRNPEQTFGKLRSLLPPAKFPDPGVAKEHERRNESDVEIWQGWFGLMALCPKLFATVSCFYVPVLSVDVIKSWRVNPSTKALPAIWTMLLDSYTEEPGTTKEWFYVAILRRLPELASVASDFVLLLSELSETSAEQGSNSVATRVGNNLSTLVYRTLSAELLPKILGSTHDLHAEAFTDAKKNGDVNDVSSFMENLKQHCHLLWSKALDRFSVASCSCCAIQRNGDSSLGSLSRTEHGNNDGSVFVETSGDGPSLKLHDKGTLEVQPGCLYRDPIIRLCQLTLLFCSESVVADLLVNSSTLCPSSAGSFDTLSLRRLVMVMRMMWIISGQSQERKDDILELWAQQMTNRAAVVTTDQALHITLAMRELLDPNFWQNHERFLGYSRHSASTTSTLAKGETDVQPGLSWKVVYRGLHNALDRRWLNILPLMHRDDAWDLKLAVLGVLQLLSPDATTRPQVVADRLRGALGLLFSWLERSDNGDCNLDVGQSGTATALRKPRWRWHYACANEHLKSIIIELSSSSLPSFTLMINSLLDFSFEYSTQILTKAVLSSTSGRSSVSVAPLSTGKLDRYGKLVLASGLAAELSTRESPKASDVRLTEENQRIQSGENPTLQTKTNEKVSGVHVVGIRDSASASKPTPEISRQHLLLRSKIANAELGSLLRRTLERAVVKSVELLDAWPCHPVNVLATQLADRLETPHEVPMKMEQYEEVLPKYISSPRHIFLTDCFSQYALLMEMVELVVKHGGNRALRCVEFVRVLLADSISSWHGTFRPRWPHSLLQPKGEVDEAWNRMQASRLIQLVASAHWLPPPLAASAEIVGVIDGSDIADLLLLVWRCMHHTIAFGPKSWEESSCNLHAMETQGLSTPGSAPEEEGGKEGTFTEWEGHFFAILRRNVSKIGAHFAQVYPVRKAF